VFHVELRQFPHQARAFNLTAEELEASVVSPWRQGVPVELQDRRWDPRRAKLVIYEGRRLEASEIGLGRGWANVTRSGTAVTDSVLKAPAPPERLDDLAAALADGPLTLAEAEAKAAELGLQPEQAIWQLLREGRLKLTG
jgi:hypothetical protein